jgi:hypothetical protein
MKQIILIHGSPEPGEEMVTQESITPDWFRWLKETLPNVIIPPFPLETEVVYQNWSRSWGQWPPGASFGTPPPLRAMGANERGIIPVRDHVQDFLVSDGAGFN